jgi:FMN phosphatase YigB (HAD superfamily)
METTGLKGLFEIQTKQNSRWIDKDRFETDKAYRMQTIKDIILGINDQNNKLLSSFNWKKHSLVQNEDVMNAKEQIIDMFKFQIGLFSLLGGNYEEFVRIFQDKTFTLEKRWDMEFAEISENNKVMLFDIDNTLGDYSGAYTKFLENEIGLERKVFNCENYSFYEQFGITRQLEEKYNSYFIQSGGFRNLPVYEGVVELLDFTASLGIKNILITARPSWIYKRIFTDTYYWLDENKLKYDLVLWDKDKADAIINRVFPANVLYMVEDRDKHCFEVANTGVDVLLLDKSYNKAVQDSERIKRINSLDEIPDLIKSKL